MTTDPYLARLENGLKPPEHPSGPIAIDLFAGAGGLTIGLKAAGVRTRYAVELDSYRVATFAGHSPDVTFLGSDVREIAFSKFRGRVDLVYGGPPCQPFSSGGHRKASSDQRNMIPEFVRAIREISPRAFLMENVPGLMVGERRNYLRETMRELGEMGYPDVRPRFSMRQNMAFLKSGEGCSSWEFLGPSINFRLSHMGPTALILSFLPARSYRPSHLVSRTLPGYFTQETPTCGHLLMMDISSTGAVVRLT